MESLNKKYTVRQPHWKKWCAHLETTHFLWSLIRVMNHIRDEFYPFQMATDRAFDSKIIARFLFKLIFFKKYLKCVTKYFKKKLLGYIITTISHNKKNKTFFVERSNSHFEQLSCQTTLKFNMVASLVITKSVHILPFFHIRSNYLAGKRLEVTDDKRD